MHSRILRASWVLNAILAVSAHAQFVVPWYTIDGGGHMYSSGGGYSLGGTIGQPDAGAMSGGGFTLQGGFWAGAGSSSAGAPQAIATTAALRKNHGLKGDQDIAINLSGTIEAHDLASESRNGGITELRVVFDVAPGAPAGAPISIEEQVCASCPCTGTEAAYSAYTGSSAASATVNGNELIVTFTPGLENARTYRLTLGDEVTSVPGQAIEIRGLRADVNSDGSVNALDRSVVIGVWTGANGFSAATDINLSGTTDALDRSIVIGAWTGAESCAP